jgi:protein-L-isoaspartate(D-aspartate) O-methyltransferase
MDFANARRNMVESQLRTNRVTMPQILSAMGEIPRERFVPAAKRAVAYVDEDLPIGSGRYIMEPMVLGRLLEAAAVQPGDVALVVGCGTGYSAAVLAKLASMVFALERERDLSTQAATELTNLALDNAVVIEGRVDRGYPDQRPYDVILIDGAVAQVPPAIVDQLAEGGRLVTVIGAGQPVGRATLMLRRDDFVSERTLFEAAVPTLPGFRAKAGFVF